ncbi:MAG: Sir2 silent information regulator family NAD-dependent deacetylase, partial [Erysipelotrichaceae bacterium]|nr:Sir2 silent information regulator family NAD-dependent deacetylase [Erysipelotrichaceae bacterium]
FLRARQHQRVLFLELGVGMNTPVIIKYPFWQMTNNWDNAVYACLNLGEAYAPQEIADKSVCINADTAEVIRLLSEDLI